MAIILRTVREPIAGQAYTAIRRRILDLQFKPGEPLSESRLAVEFGLSRTPVREALKRLETDGLVEVVPQHGTFVSPIRRCLVMDAQFARAALECAVVRQAATDRPDHIVEALERNLREQEAANARGDFDEVYRVDEAMHQMLTEAAGRAGVWSLIADTKIHMDRARKLTMGPNYAPIFIKQHRRIIDAVIAKRPDEAAKAMDVHLRFVVERFDDIVADNPAYVEEVRRKIV